MTRIEPKENSIQRIKDALEFLESAKDNLEKGRFKASVDNAVDAAIAANDAFTISLIQQMPTSDHQEAIRLHKEAGKKISANQSLVIKQLLDLRHQKTYRPVAVSKATAEDALGKSIMFVRWVQCQLKI